MGGLGNEKSPDNMTNIATTPIYGKTFKVLFSRTSQPRALKVSMQHWVLKFYKDCSNDDLGMTLTFLTTRSEMGKC